MRLPAVLLPAALALVLAPAAGAQSVRIEHAAARVLIIPEARADVAYEIASVGPTGLSDFHARREGEVLVLDQGLEGLFGVGPDCLGSGDRARVRVPGRGAVPVRDLPLVVVRTPLDARVSGGPAVYGETRASQSLDLTAAGCGDWRLADVKGALKVHVAGSGDVRGGSAGSSRIDISGSGDVSLGAVQALDAHVAGSGDVRAARIEGPIEARIAGSGNVRVDAGRAPSVLASIAGSGDLRFGGTAGDVTVQIVGAGDVDVAHATGTVSKRVVGSGEVNVGR